MVTKKEEIIDFDWKQEIIIKHNIIAAQAWSIHSQCIVNAFQSMVISLPE